MEHRTDCWIGSACNVEVRRVGTTLLSWSRTWGYGIRSGTLLLKMGRGQRFCFLYGGKMVWDVDGWSWFLEVIFLSFVGGNLGWGMDMWRIVGSYCLLHGIWLLITASRSFVQPPELEAEWFQTKLSHTTVIIFRIVGYVFNLLISKCVSMIFNPDTVEIFPFWILMLFCFCRIGGWTCISGVARASTGPVPCFSQQSLQLFQDTLPETNSSHLKIGHSNRTFHLPTIDL